MDVARGSAILGSSKPRLWRTWTCTVAVVLIELLTFAFVITSVIARDWQAPNAGWGCHLQRAVWSVDNVDTAAFGSGLRANDQVLEAGGHRAGWLDPTWTVAELYPGQEYTLRLRRDARILSLHLLMEVDTSISKPDVATTILIAWLLFLAGLWIRLGGPRNKTTTLGSATFLLAGFAMCGPVLLTYPGWNSGTAWVAIILASIPRPLQMAVGWDFLSRFPHQTTEGSAIGVLRRSFYVAGVLIWTTINGPVLAELAHIPYPSSWRAMQLLGWHGLFGVSISNAAFDSAVSIAACYVLIRNYILLADRDSRRRLRWAMVSFGTGAISVLSLRLIELGSGMSKTHTLDTALRVTDMTTTFAIGLIPVALAYAVVKHRVLDVRLVIRRGLQYLLAKNVLRLLLLAPVLIVAIQVVRDPNRSFSDLVLRSSWRFYLLVMGTAALSLRYRHDLGHWLDRQFFRVALQEEETWVTLIESIQAANNEGEIANAVAHQIQLALPVEGISVFFRSGANGELRTAFGQPAGFLQKTEQRLFGPSSALLRSTAAPIPLSFDEPNIEYTVHSRGQEALLLPLTGTDGVNLGALVLGAKKSEQPYSRKERELLQAIAIQMVMACEVLQLKRSIDRESRQRLAVVGRLDRENIQLLNECLHCGECYDASQSLCPVDGTPLELTLPVERVVADRYRLNRRIGSGGMGVVFEALDLRLNRLVAVKILLSELFGNRDALARFRREAHAIASLRHPNIVGVHDFGSLPAGGAFLVMDLVPGLSWRKHLRLENALGPERVAGWVEGLCAGIAAAHSSGIVHRDIKPENVMISESPGGEVAVVLDFGLAKLHQPSEFDRVEATVIGSVMGTRSYMSPEQRLGEKVGPPTDIYSIAVMTLETLARWAPPITGATSHWANQALQRINCSDSGLGQLLYAALADLQDSRIQRVDELGSQLSAGIRAEKPMTICSSRSDDEETLSLGAAN